MIEQSERIKELAKKLAKEDGWGNPDMTLAINDSAFGGPVDDYACPVWQRYEAKARAMIGQLGM